MMRWTLPNILTVSRICLTPVIALLPFFPGWRPKLAAFAIFLAAAITDTIDGWLARRYQQVSELGQFLDPIADKLLLFATLVPIYWLTNHAAGGVVDDQPIVSARNKRRKRDPAVCAGFQFPMIQTINVRDEICISS